MIVNKKYIISIRKENNYNDIIIELVKGNVTVPKLTLLNRFKLWCPLVKSINLKDAIYCRDCNLHEVITIVDYYSS